MKAMLFGAGLMVVTGVIVVVSGVALDKVWLAVSGALVTAGGVVTGLSGLMAQRKGGPRTP